MFVLLTSEELTKPQGELQRAAESPDSVLLGRSHWTVTRVYADLLALCSHCLTLALISSGLCGRGRGLTGGQPGAHYSCLSVIRSGSVLLAGRDLLSELGLENPTCSILPSLPLQGPFATDGSRLIYIAESCDGAPPLPSFVLPSPSLPTTSRQHCSNWKDKQFDQSRTLDGGCETLALFPFNVSFSFCGSAQ